MASNPLLPINTQSWSYHLTSGADFSSANYRSTISTAELDLSATTRDKGSLLLGKNYGNAANLATESSALNRTTNSAINGRFQVIRTGSGDIEINSARNTYLLNQFATIYSAGTLLSEPTKVQTSGDFIIPYLTNAAGGHPSQGSLGAIQQRYFVQYSLAGGNVSITAGEDIARMTRDVNSTTGGKLINDSSRQLPNNWLDRRGSIDSTTGESGAIGVGKLNGTSSQDLTDPNASTTWWVDFSNFFEGVGTLGGGNILLSAGHDVKNIDALAPTNARMAGGKPDTSKMVELGGGDITVVAARNIDGGVYYVERGKGALTAGKDITTNNTRSPSLGILQSLTNPDINPDSNTWLPTTLFVGKGGFDIQSAGDLLLGPSVNSFLQPQGINNKYWYKTYFNTFADDSYISATSLGGTITIRTESTLPNSSTEQSILSSWYLSQYDLGKSSSPSNVQPWLRLAETKVVPFETVSGLMAPTLKAYSLGGSINIAGSITLYPSRTGQLELVAKNSIIGLQPTGLGTDRVQRWVASSINVSDTDPNSLPRITTPYSYFQVVGRTASAQILTDDGLGAGFLDSIKSRFDETGSTTGVLQDKQQLHTPAGLHKNDDQPLRIYAAGGNIEGIKLFSPKESKIIAGRDIGDISLYIQNLLTSDVSVVSAGRDLVLYSPNTVSRAAANASISSNPAISLTPQAGDIQIAGPGNLEVLAGRNLDLGLGAGNPDGTGSGITSVGNGRNPYLSVGGADLVVAAGIGPATNLAGSALKWAAFINDFVNTPDGLKLVEEADPGADFATLTPEQQANVALQVFYLILRNAGRDHTARKSDADVTYTNGYAAIESLFGKGPWAGEILTQGRDIRTRSGGDIRIIAPGGSLTLANTTLGNPLTPPGIVTESGGKISIFTDQNVDIGIGRIFTLRGGDQVIWSTNGDIAAGSSSRTVSAAPPTRVIIDPQSAAVQTDLAGLATGGGIGALASVAGVEPANIDLIAPTGQIDAGDAGISATGNINVAAVTVVNAGNISAGETSTGAPAAASAPSVTTVTSASNSTAASTAAASETAAKQGSQEVKAADETLSLITVEVIGYGGGGGTEDEEDKDKDKDKKAAGGDSAI
ncbi:MAG: filamentous hemagglutinin family protein [Luteolibacter sp.]